METKGSCFEKSLCGHPVFLLMKNNHIENRKSKKKKKWINKITKEILEWNLKCMNMI